MNIQSECGSLPSDISTTTNRVCRSGTPEEEREIFKGWIK
jgi:hypothetical protein